MNPAADASPLAPAPENRPRGPGSAPRRPGGPDLPAPLRGKVYPRAVTGVFARWRVALIWITQAVFYGLPWLQWDGRQAMLFDLEARRFFMFGTVLHPQDFIYLTGLLVIAAMALFLFTAVAGRVWCGYACPQTVYTEIFLWIEKRVEGDRARRMKLDRAAMSPRKAGLKLAKHAAWLAVALWTGLSFVGYFSGIRGLPAEVLALQTGPWESFWMIFYAGILYANAGFLREQVCTYMCPYARFQSALIDGDTMVVTYDSERGDPRGSRPRKADPKLMGLGDCIDCGLCVEVCPTGIDIRKGLQNECIGCAACVDACDDIMGRVGYPKGLIRYDSGNGLRRDQGRVAMLRGMLRPRVLAYAALLVAATLSVFTHMALRSPLRLDVIRDRGVLAREVEDGMIENVYRVRLSNHTDRAHRFTVAVGGLPSAVVATEAMVDVEADSERQIPVRVRVPHGVGKPGSNAIEFSVEARGEPSLAIAERSTFFVPR
ncbi:cytochrome c oxidase accessory protein CcoG [Quisquiliibacterium transsilvanicum]|uniref:cytochrome c oxidase accessory protein CcoG n=1 Tax=Quisquiliibacterium transsilvanicum TaxID=1549638 RepID=UPI001607E5C8